MPDGQGGLASAVVGTEERPEESLAPTSRSVISGVLRRGRMGGADAIKTLQEAQARIRARKPDKAARWLAFAQGMLAPTRTGGFGESLGRTAGLLGETRRGEREEAQSNEDRLLDLQLAEHKIERDQYAAELAAMKPITVPEKATVIDPEGNIIFPRTGQYATDQGLELKDRITIERGFRKDFVAESKNFIAQDDAYGRILASAKDPSAAGDLALVFNYMKVLDPMSVVRESEFRTAQNARGALQDAVEGGEYVPSFLFGIINKLAVGELMTPVQRADFVERAGQLYADAAGNHASRENEFRRIAEFNKLNPEIIVGKESIIREAFRPEATGGVPTGPGAGVEVQEGQTATGPQGEKMIFTNGQWVPM